MYLNKKWRGVFKYPPKVKIDIIQYNDSSLFPVQMSSEERLKEGLCVLIVLHKFKNYAVGNKSLIISHFCADVLLLMSFIFY